MPKDIDSEDGQASSPLIPGSTGDLVDTARHESPPANADQQATRRVDNGNLASEPSSPLTSSVSPRSTGTSAAGRFEPLSPGKMLGKCRIERLIGQGGMGAVYLAHHLALDVPVAVKVLISRPGKDMDELIHRFIREARLASRIRHPHVVQMLDVGTDEETGIDYIVQEYVGGGSVSDLMKKGPLEEGQALDIIISVASALAAAAEFNIVHRDIKPENILLTGRGEAKLADLGIAKECNGEDGGLTVSHVMMGTPFYVAPEQARNTKRVDVRADIYSLGATLYHMLCGQPPYPGETAFEVLSNLIAEPVPDPRQKRPDLSAAVSASIMRMMAKDPADRPATAVQLLEELKVARRATAGAGLPLFSQLKPFQHLLLRSGRRRWPWLAALAGVAVLAGAFWFSRAGGGHQVPVAPPATGVQAISRLQVPPGCQALPGTTAEPYTKTTWAKEIVHEATGIELAYIPAGEFEMGSPAEETGREEKETRHQVRLTKGFYLGKCEVTQAQWEKVNATNPSTCKTAGAEAPVESVTWHDCQEFCEKAGPGIRLPTEAEWEYACRAGTTGTYGGSGHLEQLGWYLDNSGGISHPVGKKARNDWGLYDMHGNVWEWCQDWHDVYPAGMATDPAGPDAGVNRVVRGGCWNSAPGACRSASRFKIEPGNRIHHLGFRVVLDPATANIKAKPQDLGMRVREIVLPGKVKLELLRCPAGTFTMGSPASEAGRKENETQHLVTLTKPFWLGKHEVTQAQWQALMGNNPSQLKAADLPVERISWNDADAFCRKLTAGEAGRIPADYEYRLPTEAEWEYACRAGNAGPYANSGRPDDMGWSKENSEATTHPGGQKQPNAWGLHDMHGNVWEWCQDWSADYPGDAAIDPVGPATGVFRVIRGGSMATNAGLCRAASRGGGTPVLRYDDSRGLRVALAPVILRSEPKPPEASMQAREIILPGNVKLELRRCPAGTFMMGSPTSEVVRENDEVRHPVTLTKVFWLGKHEVTQAQWEALMGYNPSDFKGAALPVEQVSWNDAVSFCKKLTASEAGRIPDGYEYRLPTEAEWEYASRAGSAGPYGGSGRLEDMGWYDANSMKTTHPVGQKQQNAWGLFDMHGNVSEWCQDWSADDPAGAVADPAGPVTGEWRVFRGGSWSDIADHCRSALRNSSDPSLRGGDRGFRVALAPVVTLVAPKPQETAVPVREAVLPGDVKLELCGCPSGDFTMGSPADEAGHQDIETPHQVIQAKPFWIGKYEVTQAQWQALMGNNHSGTKGDNLPVEQVSWDDAMFFCKKLTTREAGRIPAGYVYRLPTEAEWEYACRAGSTGPYAGSGRLDEMGWYDANSGGQSHPVGQKKPNAWGLHDMHGNVHEWCLDWAGGSYPVGPATDSTVAGPATGTARIIRGGSKTHRASFCRAAMRGGVDPDKRFINLGFRVALAPVIQ